MNKVMFTYLLIAAIFPISACLLNTKNNQSPKPPDWAPIPPIKYDSVPIVNIMVLKKPLPDVLEIISNQTKYGFSLEDVDTFDVRGYTAMEIPLKAALVKLFKPLPMLEYTLDTVNHMIKVELKDEKNIRAGKSHKRRKHHS